MAGPRDVLRFPPGERMTPEQALASAAQRGLVHVYIVGITDDGTLITRASEMTRAEALWMLKRAERWTLGGG